MILFRLKILLRIIAACYSTFGLSKELLFFLLMWPLLSLLHDTAFLLDNIFFPGYRKVEIKRPFFIMGHPRSGTTFLHRLLTQTGEFAVFKFWHLSSPSLVARKIISPLVKLRIRRGGNVLLPKEAAHETTLSSIEEEEFLFFRILNTQFVDAAMAPLGFGNKGFLDLVYADQQPQRIRQKTIRFFKQCLKRQVYYLGKSQVIAKMTYSVMRIQSLLAAFPDARIVYVVRSPYETIPSHLSLFRNIIDHRWGLNRIPPERLRLYFERRYDYDVRFYQYVEELICQGVFNGPQFMTISYDLLKNDLGKTIEEFLAFTGLTISKELQVKIKQQIQSQGSYRPKHQNLALEDFGLSRERIAKDLSFVFDRYGFKK